MFRSKVLDAFVFIGFIFFIFYGEVKAQTISLRFAHAFPPMHTIQKMVFEPWAKEIEKLTKGKVKIIFYPGGKLGKASDLYDLMEKGDIDICYTLHDYTPGRFPLTSVFSLPFMVPKAEITSRAMWNTYERIPAFRKEYNKVKLLALFCHPGGHFHSVKKQVIKMSDFKNMKFRTANPFVTDALRLFRAIPVSIPITETYSAIEKGVLDGTVVTWEGLVIFKLDNLINYSAEADFYTMVMMVAMNKTKYDSLPNAVKRVIDDTTGLKMSVNAGKIYDDVEMQFRNIAKKKNINIIRFSRSEMRKLESLMIPLRDNWVIEIERKDLPGGIVMKEALKQIEKK